MEREAAAMSTTLEIAKKYVDFCKANEHHKLVETLFSPDIVSVEAGAPPGQSAEVKGIPAVLEKGKKWMESHEIHSAKCEGPWPHGHQFIVRFTYDVTNKPSGQRFTMDEAALFTVKGDKIVKEEFFYSMGG
jgi:hypothetical protein